jgi:signal transduction histidine kinase
MSGLREELARATMTAVAASLAVVGIPLVGFLGWLATKTPEERADFVRGLGSQAGVAPGLFVSLVLLALAVLAGRSLAVRWADRIADPVDQLAQQAETLAEPDVEVMAPLRTGITELDQLSTRLVRSTGRFASTLSTERDFAADASHQLRTPLTALLMRLEEINETDDLEVVRSEAGTAIDQVERLAGVIDDLLARTRRTQAPARVSLDTTIAALQLEWQPAFEAARRSIRVRGERGLVVQTIPGALSQILSTLLENSLAHGGGTVGIEARRSGPSVVIEVTDEGPGIPVVLAPHVFERSVSSSGSGLGLAVARDLAEAQGGRLELLSAQPAVFALFLSSTPVR